MLQRIIGDFLRALRPRGCLSRGEGTIHGDDEKSRDERPVCGLFLDVRMRKTRCLAR